MQNTYQQQAKMKLAATFISIAVIAGVVIFADHLRAQKSSGVADTSQANTSQVAAPAADTTSQAVDTSTGTSGTYKDGTYSATNDYYVPHGTEEIKVTLSVKDGIVTGSSVENSESDHDSARYQEDFAAEYKSYVVGKKLSGIHLSYVAGASDTTQAFNDALSDIQNQAKA